MAQFHLPGLYVQYTPKIPNRCTIDVRRADGWERFVATAFPADHSVGAIVALLRRADPRQMRFFWDMDTVANSEARARGKGK